MSDDFTPIEQHASSFALEHIATRPGLSSGTSFPFDLWEEMGKQGLLGISIPEEFGGKGKGYPELVAVGRALNRSGCCLGIVLSWLMHQITARFFINGFATHDQKKRFLPDMATGKLTTCIAISEPGKGGHPKYIATKADKEGDQYRLQGEKSYLTNGPIAGMYIVLAVTGYDGDRKRFSAFIVPRETPGLTVLEPMDFGFLRPCPHGGITLNGCMISEADMLGREGTAYDLMALPFREVEDIMMMGPILGAQEARLHEIVQDLRKRPAPAGDDISLKLGGIEISFAALDLIARECALKLEKEGARTELSALILSFRRLFRQVHIEVGEVMDLTGIGLSETSRILAKDLDQIVRFAERVSALRQLKIGRRLYGA
jgi:alkylation response protein AidB-like acyl-CoA dehydrogenase